MKATELFLEDSKPAGVFFCGQCRLVYNEKVKAEKCCAPYKCEDCGKECQKYWTVCEYCRQAREQKREQERFEKAEKVTDWGGWIYADGMGFHDGYFESLADLEDYLNDEESERPEYVWATKENHFVEADISDITERVMDGAYDGFEVEYLKGLDDLKAAIEKFNEANREIVSYSPDYSKAVLIAVTNAPRPKS